MAFCANCGRSLSDQAHACPECGHPTAHRVRSTRAKDKSAAVILAVFLSFWTWLYTYERDAWKFWLGLGLTLGTFLLIWIVPIWPLVAFGVWVWAIVDVAVKPGNFYLAYPEG